MASPLETDVLAAMAEHDLHPGHVMLDDAWHRFPTRDKHHDDAGWYRSITFAGGCIVVYGDFRSGVSAEFHHFDKEVSAESRKQFTKQAKDMRRKAAQKQSAEGAALAQTLYQAGSAATTDHPYLVRKKVGTEGLRALTDTTFRDIAHYTPKAKGEPLTGVLLLVPYAIDGAISSLEIIDEAGRKSALYGATRKGAYWRDDELDGAPRIGLSEGMATAKAISEHGDMPCVAVGGCNNFGPVLEHLTVSYPGASFVVFADRGNGEADAVKAAHKAGAKAIVPPEGITGTDFNDFLHECGAQALEDSLADATLTGTTIRWSAADDAPEPDFVLPGLLAGSLGCIIGQGAIGKSFLVLEMLTAMAFGQPVAGPDSPLVPTTPGRCGAIFGEDEQTILYSRMRALFAACHYTDADKQVLDRMAAVRSGVGADLRVMHFDRNGGAHGPLYADLCYFCHGRRLVIIDPLVMMHDGEERDNGQMAQLMGLLNGIAHDTGCAIVYAHHSGKDNAEREVWAASRGASSLVTASRWQLNLAPPSKDDMTKYAISEDARKDYVHAALVKGNNIRALDDFWLQRGLGGVLEHTSLEALAPQANAPEFGAASSSPARASRPLKNRYAGASPFADDD